MTDKIQLINAPLTIGYRKSSRTGSYPPIGIASLAAYLKSHVQEVEVELFDGEYMGLEDIISQLNAPIVGISCNIMTYQLGILIAEEVSKKGSKVILGGPYPTTIPAKILQNRPYIEAIVAGDGELALLQYIQGEQYENIPNFVYRKNNKIIRNVTKELDINELPIPDYLNLQLDRYYSEYSNRYSSFKPFHKSLATYSRKGCLWRDVSDGGCVFCMIPNNSSRVKNPVKLWQEIKYFNEHYGVDHFWEVCDTFTEDDKWIKEFLQKKPTNIDIAFQIYGRANHITPRMARQLKELGVYEVFIGAESGDDTILKFSNKGCSTDQTRRAVEALAVEGINVIASFVLGLPGETSKTLNKTLNFTKELYAYGNIIETSSSILLPIPGSNAFKMLMEIDGMMKKHGSDLLNLEEIKKDWIDNYTFVNDSELKDVLDEMLSIFPLNDTFEQVGLQSAPMC